MTWTVAIRSAAVPDILASLSWYEAEAPEQVERFALEFSAAIDRIAAHADVIAPFAGATRRMRLRIFPYQVWYLADEPRQTATVIAVVHDRQNRARFANRD